MTNSINFQSDWFRYAAFVALGFPLIVLILGEIIHLLQKRGQPLYATVRIIKNLVLPILMFMIFSRYVVKLDPRGQWLKIIETLFWISVIHTSLSLVNTILFVQARENTWWARMPKLLIDLGRLFLVLVGTAIVLAVVWGADLAGLATALGVGSVVIGLALQDTLGSIMSGITLLLERPFNVGDWLKIGEIEGQVIDINWRSVRILTLQRQVVIIPHQFIGKEILWNYSQPERIYNQKITIGFSYDSPPNLVKQVLRSTALATQGILADPEPESKTLSYDETAIMYEVEFFISDFQDVEQILDRFMTRIWYAARRNNLTLYRYRYEFSTEPSTNLDTASSKLAQNLHSIPVFVPLAKEQENLADFTQGTLLQHFGSGEKVIEQGESSDALYIIISGQALMTIKNSSGQELEIITLARGEFFGEMALFSGEANPASITAIDDLEVMVFYSNVVNMMIERQPSLAREIGQVIEGRRKAIDMTLSTVSLR
jgi:small-conductance mechanosensitive channel